VFRDIRIRREEKYLSHQYRSRKIQGSYSVVGEVSRWMGGRKLSMNKVLERVWYEEMKGGGVGGL
jgi:nitroimidazol reductase NimA-like FMN-containing flavoprotein (pyridoxamine 5'-phosphate oxidase superfamily)